MKAVPNSLFEENLNCSTLSEEVPYQSQTSVTVHIKVDNIDDIMYDDEDNSIVHVKGRFKHIDVNTNRQLQISNEVKLQTTIWKEVLELIIF